jgi:hypothetical protein
MRAARPDNVDVARASHPDDATPAHRASSDLPAPSVTNIRHEWQAGDLKGRR